MLEARPVSCLLDEALSAAHRAVVGICRMWDRAQPLGYLHLLAAVWGVSCLPTSSSSLLGRVAALVPGSGTSSFRFWALLVGFCAFALRGGSSSFVFSAFSIVFGACVLPRDAER